MISASKTKLAAMPTKRCKSRTALSGQLETSKSENKELLSEARSKALSEKDQL